MSKDVDLAEATAALVRELCELGHTDRDAAARRLAEALALPYARELRERLAELLRRQKLLDRYLPEELLEAHDGELPSPTPARVFPAVVEVRPHLDLAGLDADQIEALPGIPVLDPWGLKRERTTPPLICERRHRLDRARALRVLGDGIAAVGAPKPEGGRLDAWHGGLGLPLTLVEAVHLAFDGLRETTLIEGPKAVRHDGLPAMAWLGEVYEGAVKVTLHHDPDGDADWLTIAADSDERLARLEDHALPRLQAVTVEALLARAGELESRPTLLLAIATLAPHESDAIRSLVEQALAHENALVRSDAARAAGLLGWKSLVEPVERAHATEADGTVWRLLDAAKQALGDRNQYWRLHRH